MPLVGLSYAAERILLQRDQEEREEERNVMKIFLGIVAWFFVLLSSSALAGFVITGKVLYLIVGIFFGALAIVLNEWRE